MINEIPPLQYARARPPWYQRPVPKWCLIISIFATAAGGAWWAWNSTPGEWARLMYWQQRCLHCTAAPGTLVYAFDDPSLTRSMLASGASTTDLFQIGAFFSLKEWRHVESYVPRGYSSGGIAYLHGRNRPDGANRLVAVHSNSWCEGLLGEGTSEIVVQELDADVITPSFGMHPRSFINTAVWAETGSLPLHVFAGQTDPTDPTRFTIPYNYDGRNGTIEGKLQDDDTVIFRILDGSLQIYPGPLPVLSD